MKILVLNWRDLAHPSAGGAERYVHEVASRWAAQGHRVTLFCARPDGLPASEQRDGLTIVRAGSRLGVYREATRYLHETAGSWDAVVESVNTRPFFAHRHAEGTPTVAVIHQLARDVWFHEAPLPVALAGRFIFEPRWLARYRGAPVVAVSRSTAEDLGALGIAGATIASPGTPAPPPIQRRPGSAPSLVYLGRLKASKRPDAAVAAWRLVGREMPGTTLTILGDGPMRARLEGQASPGLRIAGSVDEATKWRTLAAADLLLVPSVREGWGIVVMEAGVVGTPAVGYRVPGLRDSIRDGETGWLCDPTPEAMAAAAVRALRAPERAAVGRAAQERARGFTWEETAARILDRVRVPQEVQA